MGEIVMVRHGQAMSGAESEEDYDRLSKRGRRQAEWLGHWLGAHEKPFDRIVSGSMRRHRETAEALALGPADPDPRLNELDYFTLAREIEIARGIGLPKSPEDFADHVVQTFAAWHDAEIAGAETFGAFEARVGAALHEMSRVGERVLVVTSGGVIAMTMRLVLGLGPDHMAQVVLPIYNSSLHRFRVLGTGTFLSAFNAIPHLDAPGRAGDRSFI